MISSKRIFIIFLAISILIIAVTTGCMSISISPPVPHCCPETSSPNIPKICNLTVQSNSGTVYGYVYINGISSDIYLDCWQTVFIPDVPCNQTISVFLIDEWGIMSHTEYIVTSYGENKLVFSFW